MKIISDTNFAKKLCRIYDKAIGILFILLFIFPIIGIVLLTESNWINGIIIFVSEIFVWIVFFMLFQVGSFACFTTVDGVVEESDEDPTPFMDYVYQQVDQVEKPFKVK